MFILTQSILEEVDKICRAYLWGNADEKKKVALVSWGKVYYPKRTRWTEYQGQQQLESRHSETMVMANHSEQGVIGG